MTAILLPMRSGGSRSHSLAPCGTTICADMAGTRAYLVPHARDVDARARTPMRPHGFGDVMPTPCSRAARCGAPHIAPPSLAPI
jgi:hypothetical protein